MSILRLALSRPLRNVSLAKAHPGVYTRHARQFSASLRWQASPTPEEFLSRWKHTKLFKDIQANKELRDTLMDAARVLQEEGFDMKKPSMMMLVTNAKVREAVAKVTKAVKEAGVDGEALKEAMEVMKTTPPPGSK